MAGDRLTWILQKGYFLVSGKRKETHHLAEELIVYFLLPHHLLRMSTPEMTPST